MSAPSVLYDAPGPKARARNVVYTVAFSLVLLGAAWFVVSGLNEEGQLDAELWKPFVADSRIWTEFLLPGLGTTLEAAAAAILIALPVGAIFGIARLSDHAWVRALAGALVEFFRAIPVLVLMIFCDRFYYLFTDISPDNRTFWAVVTALVLYNGSVLAEVVRAGILSLPRGQTEASLALGLRKTQTMTLILLPQAVTAMLPAIVSQLVVVLKDTAIGGAMLTLPDLLSQYKLIANNYNNTIPTLIVIAALYIVINTILTQLAGRLERRLSRRNRPPAGVREDHIERQDVHLAETKTGEASGA
ncbi:glutamate transport system permease protein [Streptoalloteichus tenebrarius]|uniref:Glutamate transport system permease protein n=1 Tax=Streptoalloteichus tenebrarius (strain ATCC 17920 / DSM 40477 / JCM 4838 / CBS 697.72 / NBRC 16177 / NCIMB 11028 / NRRL B-12390 / A12253. 1 / ISP 5477) TaxID=1933 RepID=A0ABT1HMM9_STRSD|nr:amino acid ABC transporter permease [Streptoalloteichus tenebrarius]MCP2256769.1 glutamate transport system permease protein [Streptoalloteichus tenebrarius]BFF00326.1 amino acid ABC transporter permease [Streptoalloteichus tenebrarius]